MRKTSLAVFAAAMAFAAPAAANEFEPMVRAFAESSIAGWVGDGALVAAIQAQNAETAGFDAGKIDALDKEWRAQVGAGSTPLIDSVLGAPASDFLRARRDEAGGVITEIFVMDAKGLNVAASDVTSDYWQGDEAKWQKTFGNGSGDIHISEVEYDDSTGSYQSQVSMPVKDPATGELIGAITFGINVQSLL